MTTKTFVLSSNRSEFTQSFSPSIELDRYKKYEAALQSFDVYNSIPNIKQGENSLFIYSNDNGNIWKTIDLGTGSYELDAINSEIQDQMVINGDYNNVPTSEQYITIFPNISKLTSIIRITNPSYEVDFRNPNTIGSLLGFSPTILKHGNNESANIVNINSVNSILVNIDIVEGTMVNSKQ